MRINKVLLINLPDEGQCTGNYTPDYAIGSFSVYPPLGLLYIATAVKDFYPVEILDVTAQKFSINNTIEEIIERSPTVLGISCQTLRLYPMVKIIEEVKSRLPEIVVVIGGPHTTIYPIETINLLGVDYVIIGDGEHPFKVLLDSLDTGSVDNLTDLAGLCFKNNDNKIILNSPNYQTINNLEIHDRSLLDYKYYYTAADREEQVVTMISSRGCPFKCIFCDIQEKKYRARNAKNIVDEMEQIIKTFNNPMIHVFDDNFNFSRRRVFEICSEIQNRKLKVKWTTRARVSPLDEDMVSVMAEAGLRRIHFGVESGSKVSLKKMKKGITRKQIIDAFKICNKYNIDILAYFIIGFSWEKEEDINETIKFIKELRPKYIFVNILFPSPKTEIYKSFLEEGKIDKDYWQEFTEKPIRNFKLPQYLNKRSQQYLKRKLDQIYLNFYLSPKFVLDRLKYNYGNNSRKFYIHQLFFNIRLAFLILKSYIVSFLKEFILIGGGENEFKYRRGIINK